MLGLRGEGERRVSMCYEFFICTVCSLECEFVCEMHGLSFELRNEGECKMFLCVCLCVVFVSSFIVN